MPGPWLVCSFVQEDNQPTFPAPSQAAADPQPEARGPLTALAEDILHHIKGALTRDP